MTLGMFSLQYRSLQWTDEKSAKLPPKILTKGRLSWKSAAILLWGNLCWTFKVRMLALQSKYSHKHTHEILKQQEEKFLMEKTGCYFRNKLIWSPFPLLMHICHNESLESNNRRREGVLRDTDKTES